MRNIETQCHDAHAYTEWSSFFDRFWLEFYCVISREKFEREGDFVVASSLSATSVSTC